MFGERYFATRQKLGAVVHDARELARNLGVELNGFSEESELLQGLENPFLFVVSGEVNAGKSTLINGLFGEELCSVNVLPETQRVLWYRYGKDEHDDEITEILEERYRSIEFLSDFNIVDTPGTNSVVRGHQAITESFLPVADLVLFVFPVSNPWGAATWDFIARFPEELRGKVAFVLQQKDLRNDNELAIIMEHMRELARQKMGETPDVFAVSGKQAMQAKLRRPFEDKIWKSSGYPELEAFISRIVTNSPSRRQVLRDVRDATSRALRRIEDQIDSSSRTVERKMRVLRDLENETDHQRDAYGSEFEEKLQALGGVFVAEGEKSLDLLRKRVAVWPSLLSLFRRDESPAEIERSLSSTLEGAIGEMTEGEAEELRKLCGKHWEHIAPRIKEKIELDPPKVDGGDVNQSGAREHFVRRMARAARQSAVKLKLRGLLEMQLDSRRSVLQRFVVGTLVLLSIGGALGAAGLHPYSWLAVSFAIVLGTLGVVQAQRSGAELVKWFGERIQRSQETFADMLSSEYREGVRDYFKEYAVLFEKVRRELLKTKAEIKPRHEEWNELFLELKAIEQDL
ncbi:MAG: dynamin family protein [Roseibacillus sp.]